MLTIFQIYINDMTDDKKYFRKIITVEDYITNLNNPCKNIKQLVEENKKGENKKGKNKEKQGYSNYIKLTSKQNK